MCTHWLTLAWIRSAGVDGFPEVAFLGMFGVWTRSYWLDVVTRYVCCRCQTNLVSSQPIGTGQGKHASQTDIRESGAETYVPDPEERDRSVETRTALLAWPRSHEDFAPSWWGQF